MVANPGIVTGWSGVGVGKLWAGPDVGVKVTPPRRVLVVAWKPDALWNAVAVALTASRVREPRPPEARVTWAMEWVECEATTPPRSLVQTWVRTPEACPNPGIVAVATSFVRSFPARVVQLRTRKPVREDPTGTSPPTSLVPKPVP